MSTYPLSTRTLTRNSALMALIIIACASSTAVLSADSKDFPKDEGWSEQMGEKDVKFGCPQNTALTGRSHFGDEDEKAEVHYKCNAYSPYGDSAVLTDDSDPNTGLDSAGKRDLLGDWSGALDEGKPSGHAYVCPAGTVMTGREHKGDENGSTYYRCSTLKINGKPETIGAGTKLYTQNESAHTLVCPAGQVLIGRQHHCSGAGSACDENQATTYTCGYVKPIP